MKLNVQVSQHVSVACDRPGGLADGPGHRWAIDSLHDEIRAIMAYFLNARYWIAALA